MPVLRAVVHLLALALIAQPLASAEIVVGGLCTLNAAIRAANQDLPVGGCTAGSGADTIVLAEDVLLDSVDNNTDGPNGTASVTSAITLEGGGNTVTRTGGPAFRIFHVQDSGDLTLSEVGVSNGIARCCPGDGGVIYNGGGNLTLNNVAVSGGNADQKGGGIYNAGSLTINDSSISDNALPDDGLFSKGGGIFSLEDDLLLVNTTVSGNYSAHLGGGIYVGSDGQLEMVESTVSGNSTGEDFYYGNDAGGGGLWLEGTATITNSSVSGNSAIGANFYSKRGGGIHVSGSLALINSTLAGNTATVGDSIYSVGSVTSMNSILGCAGFGFVDSGGNFETDGLCPGAAPITPGVDFDDLADNGGPTETHALLPGSVAIDAASDCGLQTDQRGLPRVDGACDSGSFELLGDVLLLGVFGPCPGEVAVTIWAGTPNSEIVLLGGADVGVSSVPPGRPCEGLPLGLASPFLLAVLNTDLTGTVTVDRTVTLPTCGMVLQAVDMAACEATNVVQLPDEPCFDLALSHTGQGANLLASPVSSPDCTTGTYNFNEVVTLTAAPDPGWEVSGWHGTDDDSSTDVINTLTMPPTDHEANVDYVLSCLDLTLSHTGMGVDPVAAPIGVGEAWVEHEVQEDFDQTRSVHAADVDGDGDVDVLGAARGDDEIAWWENRVGDGTLWQRRVVASSFDGANSVFAADVDGDGDTDVLGAAVLADAIVWWENVTGDGLAWAEHSVTEVFDGAYSVFAADVDGDGDTDVAGATQSADSITWWENINGDGSAWTEHTVGTGFDGAASIFASDLDGDGDIDLLGAAQFADDITWWENVLVDGTLWTEHTVEGDFDGANSVRAADLDDDGDLDVLASAEFADDITWWENAGGDGTVWTEHTVAGDFDGAQSVYAADVDGDGDLDVLGAARSADAITWWENTAGDGTVWTEHSVADFFDGARSVFAADLDGDGDSDVLAGQDISVLGPKDTVTWWKNVAPSELECVTGGFQAGELVGLSAFPGPGWGVGGWTGTEDDQTNAWDNRTVMPVTDHAATVQYLEGCFALTLTHDGPGADPVATPVSSDGCDNGTYVSGQFVELLALPDPGSTVVAWSGTEDDLSSGLINTLQMPASDHTVSVAYDTAFSWLTLSHAKERSTRHQQAH